MKVGKFLLGILLIIMLVFSMSCTESKVDIVEIAITGSDSELNLVQSLSEEFMLIHPNVSIAVTGGGSGTGIAALIDNTINIANSSRPIKEEELQAAKKNGVEVTQIRFSTDGIAVIVNNTNTVEELSVEQIGAIFRGEITNWSEIGGHDGDITLYGRQSTSGTYVFFMEQILKNDYAQTMMNMSGNSAIVEGVRNDLNGIGYVAIGYVTDAGNLKEGIAPLKVRAGDGIAYCPTVLENITSGSYPITRPLYQFINGKLDGVIKEFILFELSQEGLGIILNEGFYPITVEDQEFNKKSL